METENETVVSETVVDEEVPAEEAPATTETEETPAVAEEPVKDPADDFSEGVKALLERTGYSLEVTAGQRKYGGPPPGWGEEPLPGTGEEKFNSQIFIGKIPKDMWEDELIPELEGFGEIYEFRLMVDSRAGVNKGYGFCTYTTEKGSKDAVSGLNGKVLKGNTLTVNISAPNKRLFVGSIPKSKSKEEIFEELKDKVEELVDVIIYAPSDNDGNKNRGFAFLEFVSHKAASVARKKLLSGTTTLLGMTRPPVDWADVQDEPDEETMAKVKMVYVKNLPTSVDEAKLKEMFEKYGEVESAKKIKDYGFVDFKERDHALQSIEELNGHEMEERKLEVTLAKPQSESAKERKKKLKEKKNFRGRGRGGPGGNFNLAPGYQVVYVGDGYDMGYDGYYAPPPPMMRGRGAPRGFPPRGRPYGRPPMRPPMAGRGGPRMRAMAPRGMPRGRVAARAGMKRPAPGAVGGPAKKPVAWEAAPIPQKPLQQYGEVYDYGADYGYGGGYGGGYYQGGGGGGYGQQW